MLQDAYCYSRPVHLVICLGTDWSMLQWSIESFHCPVLRRTFLYILRRLTSLINGTHTNQLPPVTHILLSMKINPNRFVLILTAVGWGGPDLIWGLTLAHIQFVRLLFTHPCICKGSPHTGCTNPLTAAPRASGFSLPLLCWYGGQKICRS